MKLILVGPPGAGKGTHATILCEKHSMVHLATGDILRSNIKKKTPLGVQAKETIESGNLVSDDLVNQMMAEEIRQVGVSKGFLLDGYPRTIGQAEALDQFLKNEGQALNAVLNFATSEEIIIRRLSGRRICSKCTANYHVRNIPPKKEGICDQCGSELVQRKDDDPETIKHRLETYDKETHPLIDYYKKQGLLYDVHGDWEIPELQEEIKKLFEQIKLTK